MTVGADVAVNAKDFSAAFFHISSLKNANTRSNTAASKQPNLFWFWEKFMIFLSSSEPVPTAIALLLGLSAK